MDPLGRTADAPHAIPWPGWKQIISRTSREIISDRVSMVAGGCAFWATLSLFPAISMLVSLYGLIFDPQTVEPQLATIHEFLPPAAFTLIADRVHDLVSKPGGALGINLAISTAIALWSASTGTKSLLSALNMAYEEEERRSILTFQLVGIAMTAAMILAAILGIAILVFLPVAFNFLGLHNHSATLLEAASVIVLIIFVLLALSLLYRYGPSRRAAKWKWITPGSVVATVIWLIGSLLFSLYVGKVASYSTTYGPLGAVAAVMMWFWVSAYAVMLGAELNSEMELQTAQDSTHGDPKPMGKRGAYVADHVAAGAVPGQRDTKRGQKTKETRGAPAS